MSDILYAENSIKSRNEVDYGILIYLSNKHLKSGRYLLEEFRLCVPQAEYQAHRR